MITRAAQLFLKNNDQENKTGDRSSYFNKVIKALSEKPELTESSHKGNTHFEITFFLK